jgi:hypothetical protein
MNITICRDGTEIGEWTDDEVRVFYGERRLVPTDLYWKEGMTQWESLAGFIKPPPPFPISEGLVIAASQKALTDDGLLNQSATSQILTKSILAQNSDSYKVTKEKIGRIYIVPEARYPNENKHSIRSTILRQICPVFKTESDLPVIIYKRSYLLTSNCTLVFARDCKQLDYLDDDSAKEAYKAFTSREASAAAYFGGLLASAVYHAVNKSSKKADSFRGCYAYFFNDKGIEENFACVGYADIIERIVSSRSRN